MITILPIAAISTELLGQTVQSLPGGSYFSLFKIIVMLLALFAWAFPATWVNRDAAALSLPRFFWSLLIMISATVGWLLWFIMPMFSIGIIIWLIVTMGSLLVYDFYRDSLVETDNQVLRVENIKAWLKGEGKSTAFELAEKVHLSTLTDKEIKIPEDQEQQKTYQQFQDLMFDALWRRATDIYVQPAGQSSKIALRIDGVLTQYETIDRQTCNSLIRYVKTIAELDPQQHRQLQTAKLAARQVGVDRKVELDIETAGSTAGERLVLRLRAEEAQYTINDLGLTKSQLKQLKPALDARKGILLICGLGDCGASTTLYSIGRTHDAFLRNIHTMELKSLMDLDNITQNVYSKAEGVTYATKLRSVFRKDPDIVLVDPCPDPEAAQMAADIVQKSTKKAYMTLRASGTLTALGRFIKWLGGSGSAAQTLLAITFQKLVRKLCPACRQAYRPNPETLRKINLSGGKEVTFYRPATEPEVDKKGDPIICPTCQGTGYFGRTAIFEVLEITDSVRKAIASGSATDLKTAARKSGMKYWQEVAIQKVMEGTTSMQEIVRVSKEKGTS